MGTPLAVCAHPPARTPQEYFAPTRVILWSTRLLFPVRLLPFDALRGWECFDADRGRDSAKEIREYFIPDFSEWKEHEKYKEAFERLLRDLKAGEKRMAGDGEKEEE